MPEPYILVSDCDLPGTVIEDTLRQAGLRAERAASPSLDDLAVLDADAEGLVVQWAQITGEVMDRLPNLRIISRVGIGYDMVDVEAATARGIAVANTPSYCIEEVAAHTVAMIMTQARGLPAYDRAVRAGTWKAVDARPLAVRPSTTTISVLGFGRIGSIVARGCRALGFRVLVADPYASADAVRDAGCEPVEIPDAVAQADILTLHVPLTEATKHLIDAAALATMKQGAVVVNTCRGPLIDEEALAASLRTGHLGAAALDVFAGEPLAADSPLRDLDEVLLTPHAAWYSPEALADLPVHAAQNIIRYLAGESVPIVNPTYAAAR
ncbi:C-terminal binding protein [Microbacterium saperdae]|uniref:D-3-phosphoglycerate dehydrogenase n=1 Tax=Microbacterium saperdae TaxID=69368 RepID=A0A543BB48_9MICO|nr:C-terminal binding protein [Microbacterium saperdae]TQL82060.1 D-3-phosphoglycerate dehydrogenase [Microbacterium saperdae]GGM36871.1 dehydrogenase [Microbacterium saperdae]